jgi:DNA-binding transcriptional LysR family regulator
MDGAGGLPREGGTVFSHEMKEFPSGGSRLHDYEAFIAVVDAGNLTRAAERLGRSLQSVSRSLASLETQLGVVLVRRTTRTAQPTEAGLVFHQRVSAAFREIGLAETELRDASGKLSGTLRVAGSAFFVGDYVVPAIREFSLQHPGVRFDLRISEEFTEPVSTGVDLMIRIGQLPPSPMPSRRLASIRRVAVASPSYIARRGRPETPADLARHDCIVRTSAQDARAWTFHARDGTPHRVSVDGVLAVDASYVTRQAMLAGMGIAVMPFYHARDAVEAGLAEVVLDEFTLAPVPAHALWPAGTRTPARVRRFVELLAQRLKKEVI